jgi:hypothetical protein
MCRRQGGWKSSNQLFSGIPTLSEVEREAITRNTLSGVIRPMPVIRDADRIKKHREPTFAAFSTSFLVE